MYMKKYDPPEAQSNARFGQSHFMQDEYKSNDEEDNKCDLRPKLLKDMIGQSETIRRLKILLKYSNQTNSALPHILFSGPPGLGKTSFALVLGNELGIKTVVVNSTTWRQVTDILPYLAKLEHKSILFCDEIHRLSMKVEEFLYPVLEDYNFNLVCKGKQYQHKLPKFTFIGATTSHGSLSKPLIDRFVHKENLRLYTSKELEEICTMNLDRLGIIFPADGIKLLASVSRGTPRILNNYIGWCHRYCVSDNISNPGLNNISIALQLIGIDNKGFTEQDREYVNVLKKKFHGGPAGLSTLVAVTGFSSDTILHAIEPYLLTRGIIQKTNKGRILNY